VRPGWFLGAFRVVSGCVQGGFWVRSGWFLGAFRVVTKRWLLDLSHNV